MVRVEQVVGLWEMGLAVLAARVGLVHHRAPTNHQSVGPAILVRRRHGTHIVGQLGHAVLKFPVVLVVLVKFQI